jgi:hypothetical protein
MRRQNPPQSYLDKAVDIEKYLRPSTIASMYLAVGMLYCTVIAVILTILLYTSVVSPTPMNFALFAVIGFVPTVFVFLAYFLRPNDPLSTSITNTANSWRRPIDVTPDSRTFKTHLRDGNTVTVQLSFYFPANFHTVSLKERLYAYAHAALAHDCASRLVAPTNQEIENVFSPLIETLAKEFDIPVFYVELEDVQSYHKGFPEPYGYQSTGTLG